MAINSLADKQSDYGRLSPFGILVIYIGVGAVMLMLVGSFKYPLAADYLNHLSRLHIIASDHGSWLRDVFSIDYAIVPNIAVDIAGVIAVYFHVDLAHFMKVFFLVCAGGMWVGILACHYAMHKTLKASLIFALPMIYSFLISFAFIDFVFAMIGVFFVFLWEIQRKAVSRTSVIAMNIVASFIFLSHFGAFLIMAAGVFFIRLGKYGARRQCFILAVAENIVPAILYGVAVRPDASVIEFSSIPKKLLGVVLSFDMGSLGISAFIATIFCVIMGALYVNGNIKLPVRWRPLVTGFAVLALMAPFSYQLSYCIDFRLIWLAGLLFVLAMEIQINRPWIEPAMVGTVAAVMIVNISSMATKAAEYNSNVEEFRRAIRVIPRQSPVFVSAEEDGCQNGGVERIFYAHMPSLVTIDPESIQPYIFAHHGAELVSFKPEFKSYFSPLPMDPVDGVLAAMMVSNDLTPLASKSRTSKSDYRMKILPFMDKWPERFSYVVHLTMGCIGETPYSNIFEEVARGRVFVIYRTAHS